MTVELRVPGDKSVSHRALILACLAEGSSSLRGLPGSQDVEATSGALRALGARLLGGERTGVVGPTAWRDPASPIDCGNSGTTARLLAGLIAGLGREAVLDGDESLRRRPMDRVVYPLQAVGARIRYLGRRGGLPIHLERRASGALRPLRHRSRVPSAQVKSALLLAGLASRTPVEVIEPARSRDHTERLLRHLGAPLRTGEEPSPPSPPSAVPQGTAVGGAAAAPGPAWRASFEPEGWDGALPPLDLEVPGDPSSAAFLVAASVLGGAEVRVRGVLINPTRTGFLDVLARMGAAVAVEAEGERAGEPVGALRAAPSSLHPFRTGGAEVPRLLDEVPILAVLAARARGTSVITGAGELRVKESDRLALLARGLGAVGVRCRELPDGLEIEGTEGGLRGEVRTGGDHRLAMAFGLLGRLPGNRVRVDDPACVSVSYPRFWEDLALVLPGTPEPSAR